MHAVRVHFIFAFVSILLFLLFLFWLFIVPYRFFFCTLAAYICALPRQRGVCRLRFCLRTFMMFASAFKSRLYVAPFAFCAIFAFVLP